jgi:hypothetical protein
MPDKTPSSYCSRRPYNSLALATYSITSSAVASSVSGTARPIPARWFKRAYRGLDRVETRVKICCTACVHSWPDSAVTAAWKAIYSEHGRPRWLHIGMIIVGIQPLMAAMRA